jgi:hypothetical protein
MRPADSGGPASSGTMNFPTERMRTTAGKMMSNANHALMQHEQHWSRVSAFVDRFPGFMQGPVWAVLKPYESRLRASFQWQMDFARTLAQSAEALDDVEKDIADYFKDFDGFKGIKGFD